MYEDRRLVPVDALADDAVPAQLNDDHQGHLDPLTGGGNTREHPVHLPVMRELEDDLVDHPPLADGPADRGDLRVGRHLGDEVPPVKLQQLLAAPAAGHGGHVVDVVVARHGGDRRGRVALRELAAHVPLPQLDQAPFVGGEGMQIGKQAAVGRRRDRGVDPRARA